MSSLRYLTTPDPIWRPYTFDHVTVSTAAGPLLSLLGRCHSKYRGGPGLCALAAAAGELVGAGFYGLSSARYVGFRA